MKFGLIICTYQRPQAMVKLLQSIEVQTKYPHQIVVVDGSFDDKTQGLLLQQTYSNLQYHKVNKEERGLTRQRNYGISKLDKQIEIVCFLDDDVILNSNYFEELIGTYSRHSEALGVSG
ncbi:MAG: glycosyltransferase, partial [Salinimicrobium sp.]